jgi:predicted transposase YdaD
MTKEEREMIDWAEKVQEDYKSDMISARREGRAEAAADAKAERLKSARRMKAEGFDIAFILKFIKLTPEEVEQI